MNKEILRSIIENYTIKNGYIKDFGKFENQPIYVLYFWLLGLYGFYDDIYEKYGYTILKFRLNDEEKEFFNLNSDYIYLYETDEGFVNYSVRKI